MQMVTRKEWGARPPKGSYTRVVAPQGVKIHYTGSYLPPEIIKNHLLCAEHVRQVQAMHMDGGREQPYVDIGYSLVACPHRRIFMGRGIHALPAANGPGLNANHYAVLALLGATGSVAPTAGLVDALRDAIGYLRAEGGAGRQILGHRDGYPTACPGAPLYALVKAGHLEPLKPYVTSTASTSSAMPYPGRPLQKGSRGRDVQAWQATLRHRWGYTSLVVDGVYGVRTEEATRHFQSTHRLKVDGVVGPATWGEGQR